MYTQLRKRGRVNALGESKNRLRTDIGGLELVTQRKMGKLKKKSTVEKNVITNPTEYGLELTFHNDTTTNFITNTGFKPEDEQKARDWWKEELHAWEQSARKTMDGITYGQYGENVYKVKVDKQHQQKDIGGCIGNEANWRFNFVDNEQSVKWWFQLSMDPGVIEIQTMPTTEEELTSGAVSEILELIYETANTRGFTPGGGGGHINVDFATACANRYDLIPKILKATEEKIQNIEQGTGDTHTYIDFENSTEDPFISSKRLKMGSENWDKHSENSSDDGKNLYHDWAQKIYNKYVGIKNAKGFSTFKKDHAIWLHKHPTFSQYQKAGDLDQKFNGLQSDQSLKDTLHYQAVNIDHIDTPKECERRLEFRFFKGQKNNEELKQCIDFVKEIITTAHGYK